MLGAEGSALGRGQTCSPWQSGGSLEAIPATENQAALPQDAETVRRPLALRRGNPSFQQVSKRGTPRTCVSFTAGIPHLSGSSSSVTVVE